jgi:hypothetical protein
MLSPTELITHNMYSKVFHLAMLDVTFLPIPDIHQSSQVKVKMVPKAGIEPTTFGLEGHCSSTELLGHIFLPYISKKS